VTRAGRNIELTVREFAVLHFLARHAGKVVSREQLLEHVWDESHDGSTNVVDVYVSYLRRKLEQRPPRRRLIRTVRGVGFVLESK
jgi:DNA-binding response OmpR family regulator